MVPYPQLANAGMRVRRGQTSLTVAAPGAGKSQLWCNFAQRMQVPTLFWSADTDQADVTARSIALWLGQEVTDVEAKLQDLTWREYLFERLGERSDHISWVFDPTITDRGVEDRLEAFAEINGRYPHLVVLDNLSNTVADPEREYAEIKGVMAGMQRLARTTNAHVAVLHHSTGKFENGTTPIPQDGASQNPFKTVELGLTLYRPQPNVLAINIVKNRGGESDPKALRPICLPVDFSRAQVLGYSQEAA